MVKGRDFIRLLPGYLNIFDGERKKSGNSQIHKFTNSQLIINIKSSDMLDLSNASLQSAHVSHVGNSNRYEGVKIKGFQILDAMTEEILLGQITRAFKKPGFMYEFDPEKRKDLFGVDEAIREMANSKEYFEHGAHPQLIGSLYEVITNPKVQAGEFLTLFLDNVLYFGQETNVVILVKNAGTEPFLSPNPERIVATFGVKEITTAAIYIQSVDQLMIVDKQKSDYWKNQFLGVKPVQDDYLTTSMAMDYVSEYLSAKSATDINSYLTRSVKARNYFLNNDYVDIQELAENLFANDENADRLIEEFVADCSNHFTSYGFQAVEQFEVSSLAVKDYTKVFTHSLKVDGNFQIAVKENPQNLSIEYDEEAGRKFLKIYFDSIEVK